MLMAAGAHPSGQEKSCHSRDLQSHLGSGTDGIAWGLGIHHADKAVAGRCPENGKPLQATQTGLIQEQYHSEGMEHLTIAVGLVSQLDVKEGQLLPLSDHPGHVTVQRFHRGQRAVLISGIELQSAQNGLVRTQARGGPMRQGILSLGSIVHIRAQVVGHVQCGDLAPGTWLKVVQLAIRDIGLVDVDIGVSIWTALLMPEADGMANFMCNGSILLAKGLICRQDHFMANCSLWKVPVVKHQWQAWSLPKFFLTTLPSCVSSTFLPQVCYHFCPQCEGPS